VSIEKAIARSPPRVSMARYEDLESKQLTPDCQMKKIASFVFRGTPA
jgi:hypothetical protein